jgi:hypothetical protein
MAHNAKTVNYNAVRGLPFERLLIVKDRRTHRLFKPTDARAYIKTGDLTVAEITCTITTERGIYLALTGEETQDLPLGDLQYDVLATVNDVQQKITQGTITVSALDNITPLEDALAMEIRFKKYTDFRQAYTWKDSEGSVLAVTDAFMQAKNAAGTTVIDLRWFSTIPSEDTILALPDAKRRGYIAPKAGYTLELHISDTNSVPAGSYSFDLFVKDSAGDWSSISQGQVVVEASTSVPPV